MDYYFYNLGKKSDSMTSGVQGATPNPIIIPVAGEIELSASLTSVSTFFNTSCIRSNFLPNKKGFKQIDTIFQKGDCYLCVLEIDLKDRSELPHQFLD